MEQKGANKYFCKKCDYSTTKKGNYDRHILTRKHKILTNTDKYLQNSIETNDQRYSCICGKSYKYRQSLFTHKKTCTQCIEKGSDIERLNPSLIIKLMNENINLQQQMGEQQKQMGEQQKQISELIPRIGNNNNNNINNKFNLNVFLNETCKDAMTLTDFVNNLSLTMSDLDLVGEHGYIRGTSDIFINGLKQLDITKRPIHCSDLKRETLYVKNDTLNWKKEDIDKPHVTKAIQQIHQNNFKQINGWIHAHPHLLINDHSDQSNYMKIVSSCTGDTEQDTSKIVKNIMKESVISKE